jgi:nucleoside-diphosphate-sugar epimerase
VPDICKARKELGLDVTIALDEAIRRTGEAVAVNSH